MAALSQKTLNGQLQSLPPLYLPQLSLLTRIIYRVKLWALNLAVTLGLGLKRRRKPIPAGNLPTFIKAYPVRPSIKTRIFFPKGYRSDGPLLPLYLDIHGGGFALLDAEVDDVFCSTFAQRFDMIVVALDYTRPPAGVFPGPSHDIAALANAVIDDPSLPVDKARVAIAGFSTGANLALSAAQLPALQGRLAAVLPWYPETDWTLSMAQKQATRPLKPGVPEEKDVLASFRDLFNWSYIAAGQDVRDPLLSVAFADRAKLPRWIYLVGAEYDMLAEEGRGLIMRLAGLERPTEADRAGFERGTCKYSMVKGANHGFTHHKTQQGREEEERQAKCESIYPLVGEWLAKGPFKK